jgi:hypothetical protein
VCKYMNSSHIYQFCRMTNRTLQILCMPADELIMIAFYAPPATDPYLNRIVAHVDGPSCHVELAFPVANYRMAANSTETMSMQAVCVMFGQAVEMTEKKFSRNNYIFQFIPVTSQQRAQVFNLARKMCYERVLFSPYSMLATFVKFLPLWYTPNAQHATCCSILTTQLLQAGGVIDPSLNARRVTPSGLQLILKESTFSQSFCFGATPFRLQKIRVSC